ncbi:ARM repeat-containing protein [Dacryopinax primogenitus]|uniref:ARM repeat-containing protein n=1 Tax=Dacryopinax primogenitus (strain DJM 731) TaxID=1858805 RepID=M5G1V5_DACPD|nr:ARM repeat-containing protein [Dacryopinax primogenitus]EJU02679.1 ARM repeat-containing protein [Dacryopinax primogenitus]
MPTMSEISNILYGTMSSDPRTRIESELSLTRALPNPQTALLLSQLCASEEDIALRQSAIISLKKYVREHWSQTLDGFKPPAASQEIQQQIRQTLFICLSDNQQKIRSLTAAVISTIARSDFPSKWPTLLDQLLALMSSGDPAKVHGSMTVLSELVRSELGEDQTVPLLQRMLPVLLSVLGAGQVHSGHTRARAVAVFAECLRALEMLKAEYPKQIKTATEQILPTWLEAFVVLLRSDPVPEIDKDAGGDLAMRCQIFMTLSTIMWTFPRFLAPSTQELFALSLSHLHALYPNFHDEYLLSSGTGLEIPVPGFLDDDSVACGPQLVSPILDFMAGQVRARGMKQWFEQGGVGDVLAVVVRWIQMTTDDEDAWMGDINLFVNDEDDDADTYSIRLSGLELVDELFEHFAALAPRALAETVQQSIQAAQAEQAAGKTEWWKPIEAALAILANKPCADALLIALDDAHLSSDLLLHLLRDVLPPLCAIQGTPFLQGRALIFAGRYHRLAEEGLAREWINATLLVLESEAQPVAKVSAVRAIQTYSYNAPLTLPFGERITRVLAPLLTQSTEDTLTQVLETLNAVVKLQDGEWMTEALAGELAAGLLRVLDENAKDMIFVSVLSNMFETLASSPHYLTVIRHTLPPLAQSAASNALPNPHLSVPALELITSLVKGCKGEGLGQGFVDVIMPAIGACVVAEDRDLVGSAVACLTHIVRKDCPQLLAYRTAQSTGLDQVLQILSHLLSPQESESGGLWIGDLLIHLLRRAGESLIPVLPGLLVSLVHRLAGVRTIPFIQSLVIPFAYLLQSERAFVLELLGKTPVRILPTGSGVRTGGMGGSWTGTGMATGAQGQGQGQEAGEVRTGLEVLIRIWTENCDSFQGHWATRISDLGLCQLFLSARPEVLEAPCQGSLIVRPELEGVIITRSKSKTAPIEYTTIPFKVKAIKLILGDITSDTEPAPGVSVPNLKLDLEEEEDDEEWADEETVFQDRVRDDEFGFLSEAWGDDDFPDDMDDEDLKEDPVSKMDMQAYLFAFLRDCARNNTNDFARIVDELNVEEQMTLQRAMQG